tara:strand:+ start:8058 stop:8453 length:396 start_codon:yes stop_codon:yes gene_type:complete
MNIGQAAAATGVTAKRIRYYEQIGLIEPAGRTDAGYRHFDGRDLHTLRFIQSARRLGFSMPKISNLLALWRDQNRSSADVKRLAKEHIAELEQKIAELQSMVGTLKHLSHKCSGDARLECPIIAGFEGEQL